MKHFITMMKAREVPNLFKTLSKAFHIYANRRSVRYMSIQNRSNINEKADQRVTAISGIFVKSEKSHYWFKMKIGSKEQIGINGGC